MSMVSCPPVSLLPQPRRGSPGNPQRGITGASAQATSRKWADPITSWNVTARNVRQGPTRGAWGPAAKSLAGGGYFFFAAAEVRLAGALAAGLRAAVVLAAAAFGAAALVARVVVALAAA